MAETLRATLIEVVLRLAGEASAERERASRKQEVLIAELEQHPLAWQANTRKTELHRRKLALMSQPLLTHFPTLLHIWPKTFRRTQPRHIKRRVALRLRLQVKQPY